MEWIHSCACKKLFLLVQFSFIFVSVNLNSFINSFFCFILLANRMYHVRNEMIVFCEFVYRELTYNLCIFLYQNKSEKRRKNTEIFMMYFCFDARLGWKAECARLECRTAKCICVCLCVLRIGGVESPENILLTIPNKMFVLCFKIFFSFYFIFSYQTWNKRRKKLPAKKKKNWKIVRERKEMNVCA